MDDSSKNIVKFVAALTGVLRILSFLGLGIALIGIGWAYGRIMGAGRKV